MRCPELTELPPPPPSKSIWPWNGQTAQFPELMPNGSPWPRISIVTPSYNQADFLEETIRSVLLQGYPDLEYFVVDGGSTDGSVEIIKKYSQWLTYWVSEQDEGQTDAINKGLERASGSIVNWLNSDDVFFMGALKRVALAYSSDPSAHLYNGSAVRIDRDGAFGSPYVASPLLPEHAFVGKISLPQPSIFFRRDIWLAQGRLKKHLQFAMDTEFFFSSIIRGRSHLIGGPPLSMMRIHEHAKTAIPGNRRPIFLERYNLLLSLMNDPSTPQSVQKHLRYGLNRECLRLARITLAEGWDLRDALSWFVRGFAHSPKKTVHHLQELLLGHF
jgi:glycosyltransferase involved in cell wall biosynthesis